MRLLKKSRFLASVIIVVTLISSCATLTDDIRIETQADSNINYHQFKTFAWADSIEVAFDPIGQWEQPTLDTDEEIKLVINRELRGHGFNQVESNPDLLVAFVAGVDMAMLDLAINPHSDKQFSANIPKSALFIALIDADSGYVIWFGYAMGEVQKRQSIGNIRARINYAVRQIFKPYNN